VQPGSGRFNNSAIVHIECIYVKLFDIAYNIHVFSNLSLVLAEFGPHKGTRALTATLCDLHPVVVVTSTIEICELISSVPPRSRRLQIIVLEFATSMNTEYSPRDPELRMGLRRVGDSNRIMNTAYGDAPARELNSNAEAQFALGVSLTWNAEAGMIPADKLLLRSGFPSLL